MYENTRHDLYVNNLVGDVKANHRDFYRYINSQKKGTQGIPPLKRKNGKGVAQSDLEKAEEFNGQFMDVFNKNEHTQVPLLDRSAPFINDIAVSKVATVSKNFKINLEGQNYVHFYLILSRNVKIFGIIASLYQNGKK